MTCQVTVSPQWNAVPPCGAGSVVSETTGALLPTTTGTDAEAERPVLSVTFSVASKTPFLVNVCFGFASLESTVPSASKSQA